MAEEASVTDWRAPPPGRVCYNLSVCVCRIQSI